MIDDVKISNRIYASWLSYIPEAVRQIKDKYPDLQAYEIADEDFREMPDGSGQIFCKIRDVELKMNVPKNEWKWNHKK